MACPPQSWERTPYMTPPFPSSCRRPVPGQEPLCPYGCALAVSPPQRGRQLTDAGTGFALPRGRGVHAAWERVRVAWSSACTMALRRLPRDESCGAGKSDKTGARESPTPCLVLSLLSIRAVLCDHVTMPAKETRATIISSSNQWQEGSSLAPNRDCRGMRITP